MTIKQVQPNGAIEFHVPGMESWDDFDLLTKYLVKSFGATVVENIDGICTRCSTFKIGTDIVNLRHHDDLGNYFIATEPIPEVLTRITNDLSERLNEASK